MRLRNKIYLLVAAVAIQAPGIHAQPALRSLFEFHVDLSERPDLAGVRAVDVRVRLRATPTSRSILHEETFLKCKVPAGKSLVVRAGFHKPIDRGDFSNRTVLCEIAARPAGSGDYEAVGRPYAARLVFEKPKTLVEKLRLDRWVVLGLAGQVIFTLRILIQWIATERRRKSTVPVAFWWCSLVGGLTVLVYGLVEREPIIILGQGCAFLVYLRNLYFIHIYKNVEGAVLPGPEDAT